MWWMAGEDPGKMREFEEMPLMSYLFFLDQKIGDIKRESKKPTTQRSDYG